jgi:hypothetical protein
VIALAGQIASHNLHAIQLIPKKRIQMNCDWIKKRKKKKKKRRNRIMKSEFFLIWFHFVSCLSTVLHQSCSDEVRVHHEIEDSMDLQR